MLRLSISSILSFLKFTQQLLTSYSSSSRHFYPPSSIPFNNMFQKAIPTQAVTNPVSLPSGTVLRVFLPSLTVSNTSSLGLGRISWMGNRPSENVYIHRTREKRTKRRKVKCSDVEWTDKICVKWVKWSEVKWSEVKWVTVKFLGTKVPCTLGWPCSEGAWLNCDYFIWSVSCTVVVLICCVMCECVYVWVL